jgi:hypothetical protein
MADVLSNGLFFTEVLADNPNRGGFDTDGDNGMPPLKWSTNWDMIVPFLGGLNDGWKTRKAGRYRA